MTPLGLAVLISGSGTNLKAIAEAGIPITVVVADRPCAGLEKARGLGLTTELLERTDFEPASFDYDGYSCEVVRLLQKHGVRRVALAGWMTIFGEPMFAEGVYGGRVLNTHPSLLPAFTGAHAVRQALEHGVKWTGYTCHVATLELDRGPIVDQYPVEVREGDTEASLHERIKIVERKRYPQVIRRWLAG